MEQSNVDLDGGYMIGGSKTKAGKDRYIPIASKIVPFVRRFYAQGGQYLIPNSNGGRLTDRNYRSRHFYPVLEALKIIPADTKESKRTITPHSTRHTFFNMVRSAGVEHDVITLVMGHEKYSDSIEMYGKVTEKDREKIKSLVNAI